MSGVRAASSADIPAIGAVSRAAGQPESDSGCDPDYVAHVLVTGTAMVADDGDRVIGWGAVRDGPDGSMLTDLFVHPARRGTGAGGRLLAALWPEPSGSAGAAVPDCRSTFSSQDPRALGLYLRAGLVPRWPLLYLSGPRPHYVGIDVGRVAPDVAADVERRLTGCDRRADHAYWTARSGSSGIVVRHEGEPIAAAAVGPDRLHHMVAVALPVEALLGALGAVPADTVTVRLPGPHPAVPPLLAAGFRITDFDLFMATSGAELPTDWAYSPAFA